MKSKKPNLRPLKNSILFIFLDEVGQGQFVNQKTKSGVIIPRNFATTGTKPRWGKVLRIGPECKEVVEDDYILIENLRWTEASKVDEQMIWRTTEKDVIGINDGVPDLTF